MWNKFKKAFTKMSGGLTSDNATYFKCTSCEKEIKNSVSSLCEDCYTISERFTHRPIECMYCGIRLQKQKAGSGICNSCFERACSRLEALDDIDDIDDMSTEPDYHIDNKEQNVKPNSLVSWLEN
jgi:hypothetical protein